MLIQGVSKVLGGIERSKPLQKLENWYSKDPANRLAALTITSIVIKDGIGCVKYVNQSRNNKKIPEDKRKFVTALDLTNGILMILAQIGMFFAVRKISEPLFNKCFHDSFSPKAMKETMSRYRMLKQKVDNETVRKLNVEKDLKQTVRKKNLDIFKFIVDTAAATIIGKRIIVPLIATPLAQKVEQKMRQNEEKKLHPESVAETPADNNKAEQAPKLDVVSTETNLLKQYTQQH